MNPNLLIVVAAFAAVGSFISALAILKRAKDKAERELHQEKLTDQLKTVRTSSSNSVQIYASDSRNMKGTFVTTSPSTSTSK
jgi:predicted RNA-binding protein